jgi:hypothetical protein
MRELGELDSLAVWIRPIEDAMGARLPAGQVARRLRAALADAAEDLAEARFTEQPCEATARELLKQRAADRLASLEHDREIAAKYGLAL